MPSLHCFFPFLVLLFSLNDESHGRPKSWREGPTVDPGVFVITHIRSCRNGAGYCILGHACNVDSDFVKDELGGNCTGLASAFSPPAQFVCCQQNPANFEETENDILEAVILQESLNEANKEDLKEEGESKYKEGTSSTTSRPPVTEIVTEIITETETQTEIVTRVDEVTEMVTSIVTEIVNETGAGWQQERNDLPENWMAMTEEEAMAMIRAGGVASNIMEVNEDEVNKLFGGVGLNGGMVQLSQEEALKLMGSVNRMDVGVMDSEEEQQELIEAGLWSDQPNPEFLDSLGTPPSFSSILNSVPEVFAGDWDPEAPSQPWGVPNDGNVFEFEIGAELPAAVPAPAPQSSILKPGLVIDDTPALHQGSVISTPLLSVLDDNGQASSSFVGSIEPVSLDYSVAPEIQTGSSQGEPLWYESIVLGDAVPGPVLEYEDYVTDFTTEPPQVEEEAEETEPELDCTMSILWGFQCSLSGVDRERSSTPSPVPVPLYPIDRSDPIQPEDEEEEDGEEAGLVYLSASDAVRGLVEISPPDSDLGWVTALPEQEDAAGLPESNKAAAGANIGLGFDQSSIEVSLPDQFLETTLGEEVVERETDEDEFDAFKKDTREAQPRFDDDEVVVKYHNLDKLIEDQDLLKIFMDTLENQTSSKNSSFSLTEVLHGNQKYSVQGGMSSKNKQDRIDAKQEAKQDMKSEDKQNDSDVGLPHPDFTTEKAEERRKRRQCGVKGGRSVVEAYGEKASEYMMDFFIDSWVFGKDAKQKARFEDTQARIIGGKVTSTMLYCWIAAIVTEKGDFICTGTLVADDLVVTSGSCIDFLFKRGLNNFKVVLGDSHLGLDLQFGVQEHPILKALVHENYNINDNYHYNDIGLVVLRTPARLGESVCTLCLPREGQTAGMEDGAECTVTGYGRPTDNPVLARGADYWADTTTDGVLREASLSIRDAEVCTDYVLDQTGSSTNMTSLLCAGGQGEEKACYVGMDGGSPLSCVHPSGHHFLAGIVSWGSGCGQGSAPSLFTRLTKYVSWIRRSYRVIRPEAIF